MLISTFRVISGLALSCFIVFSPADAAQLCPQPKKGLSSGLPNTHGEAISFSYNANSYPVDLFSAYAHRSNTTIGYCLRYEAVNKGTGAIERFFWPLASDLEIGSFVPKARASVLITAISENAPGIVQTKVYAFATEKIESRAYKADRQPTNETASARSGTFTAQSDGWIERIALKAPTNFPQIGTEFSDGKSGVVELSSAKWDGKRLLLSITVSVTNNKLISNLRAPVARALGKGITNDKNFYAIARLQKDVPLPVKDGLFTSSPIIELQRPELFVIHSPIAFNGPIGRVCFVASAYSPVPLASAVSKCDLFH